MFSLVDISDLSLRSLRIVICFEGDNDFKKKQENNKFSACKTWIEASCNRIASRTQQEKFWVETHWVFLTKTSE